jgi:integral membrane sensor domain MASE1
MQATQEQANSAEATTPSWVWVALLIGSALMLWWGWFIVGFLTEPSAVGRIWVVLVTSSAYSAGSAVVGVIGAIGLLRRERWARMVAGIASAAMTLTVIGAIAGIPVLAALVSSRNSNKT